MNREKNIKYIKSFLVGNKESSLDRLHHAIYSSSTEHASDDSIILKALDIYVESIRAVEFFEELVDVTSYE